MSTSTATIEARDLKVGDVFAWNDQTRVRVTLVKTPTAKTVTVHYEYLTCEWNPANVGRVRDHRFGLATQIKVIS
jgi:hypothetical protein